MRQEMSFPAKSDMAKGPMAIPKAVSAASISGGFKPSSRIRLASSEYVWISRFPTKPSQLPTTTPALPRSLLISMTVAVVSSEVLSPTTISTSLMMFAGLKKCMPRNFVGSLTAVAMASMSNVLVLEHMRVSSAHTRERLRKTSCFTSMFSKAASTTTLLAERSFTSVELASLCKMFSNCAGVSLSRDTSRSRVARMCFRPRASDPGSASMSVTVAPALRNEIAMPLPIVPAPTTPTCCKACAALFPASSP
mmetsp:Transcript_8115/g.30495  ORF Transcript_8115/g.30495 Transcript_8115/m.30495 type:complete len:251 (+) Transcript_8115:611-1363(+)